MSGRPLAVGVAEVRRTAGVRFPLHRTAEVRNLAVTASWVPDGSEVTVEGEMESVGQSIVVEGVIDAPWEGTCRRCLEPVSGTLHAEFREVFEPHPTEGETYPLGEEQMDLEPMVNEALLLALPVAPLCDQDCVGPDPERFPATVEGDQTPAPGPTGDPRWSALDGLRFDE